LLTLFPSALTWVIIALIVLSIVVTCGEVFLRFAILEKKGNLPGTVIGMMAHGIVSVLRPAFRDSGAASSAVAGIRDI